MRLVVDIVQLPKTRLISTVDVALLAGCLAIYINIIYLIKTVG